MSTPGQATAPSGVLGGGVLKADEYATFLAREYLAGYLPSGGAAVKVAVVGDSSAADRLKSALGAAAAEYGGLYVSLSAESTRVHMVDQIYFAVSRNVDWEALAADRVRAAYQSAAFPVPDGLGLTVAEVARHHDVDVGELYRSVRRNLERSLLGNPVIAAEMGRAILRLAQAQLGAGDVDVAEHEAPVRRESGSRTLEQVSLPGAVEMMNGEHRDDQVERTLGERILELRDDELNPVGREDRVRMGEHPAACVEPDEERARMT